MRRFSSHFAWFVFANLLCIAQVRSQETTPEAAIVVELLDAGAAPYRELRFAPLQGTKQVAVMTMKMNQSMTIAGQAIPARNVPANKTTIESTVDKIFENGDIGLKFTYTDIVIVDDPANPSPLAAMMKTMMQPLIGTSGNVIVTNRAVTRQVDMLIPEGVSNQLKLMIDGMKSAMNQISSPLPEEAVGLGGKWRVVQNINANGLQIKQTSVHEITELRENGFTMSVTLTQEAEPQEVKNAALPPGAKVALKSLRSKGSGKSTIKLDSMLPSTASVELTSQTAMGVEIGGQTQDLTTDMKMEMTIEPLK
jgi:hypothetical protein